MDVSYPLDTMGIAMLAKASTRIPRSDLRRLVALLAVQLVSSALSHLVTTRRVQVTTRTGDLLPPAGCDPYEFPDFNRPIVVASVMRAGVYMGGPIVDTSTARRCRVRSSSRSF